MVQLWVNLPAAHKMSKPGYPGIESGRILRVEPGSGAYGRLIAGELHGVKGPAKTFTSYGPFVMNTEAGIRQAFEDYRAGKMGRVPGK
jgi:redox-sensitive bicupin YhaK (pirin superfamily)